MKKIFDTVCLFIIFAALSCKAGAVVLDSNLLKQKIKTDVEKQIKNRLNGNIKIEIVNLPNEKIEINEAKNGKVEITTEINNKFFNPTTLVKVNIVVNGEIYKTFVVQAKISTYDLVLVAKDYIKRGEILTKTAFEERETTYLPKAITVKSFEAYKYVSEKNYNPEEVIDSNFIRTVPVIVRNNTVSVIFQTNSVSVVISAIALDNGSIGDYIKVRSKDYRKDYQGKIIGENLVLVNI